MMKKNSLLLISLMAVIIAIIVVVLLKYMGHENPTVIGGGVAGGIVGAIGANVLRKKE